MSVQTAYGDIGKAFAGVIADMNPKETISKIAEGDISYGYPVVRGTADTQCKVPSATGQSFLGVCVYTLGGYSSTDDVSKVNDTETLTVLRRGYIWVTVDEAVVAGDSAFFIHTGNVGKFRTDADTNKADAITGATFETSADANGLALLRLV